MHLHDYMCNINRLYMCCVFCNSMHVCDSGAHWCYFFLCLVLLLSEKVSSTPRPKTDSSVARRMIANALGGGSKSLKKDSGSLKQKSELFLFQIEKKKIIEIQFYLDFYL